MTVSSFPAWNEQRQVNVTTMMMTSHHLHHLHHHPHPSTYITTNVCPSKSQTFGCMSTLCRKMINEQRVRWQPCLCRKLRQKTKKKKNNKRENTHSSFVSTMHNRQPNQIESNQINNYFSRRKCPCVGWQLIKSPIWGQKNSKAQTHTQSPAKCS